MRNAWPLLFCFGACASVPPSPFFGDEKFLRIGVDPLGEASAVVAEHRAHGEELVRRIDGENFTALEFADPSRQPLAIRVVTLRGIALVLDREEATAVSNRVTYTLLAPRLTTTQDADGDGFEEIFVERSERSTPCLLVFRVRDVGSVDPVPVDAEVFGEERCPSRLEDVDGDGHIELVIDIPLGGGAPSESAHAQVPLFAKDHRFTRDGNPAALATFCAAERSRKTAQLLQAREALDSSLGYRLALELAGLAHLEGRSPAQQAAAFDAALQGFVLSEAQSQLAKQARQTIYGSWNTLPARQTP